MHTIWIDNNCWNGQTKPADFSKLINLSGSWNTVGNKNAKGVFSRNNGSVNWVFSADFSNLNNNKGDVFKRI